MNTNFSRNTNSLKILLGKPLVIVNIADNVILNETKLFLLLYKLLVLKLQKYFLL